MKVVEQKMIEAKQSANGRKAVKYLYKVFESTRGMLKGFLTEGRENY